MHSIRPTFVLMLSLVACTPAAGPSVEPTAGPSVRSTAGPSIQPSAGSSPAASPATPFPAPGRSLVPAPELAWQPVETTGLALRSITMALSVAGAYLVVGSDDDGVYFVARSTDGRQWSTTAIGAMVEPCGWAARADSTVYAAATDGIRVVLVGTEEGARTGTCDAVRAVAWVSDDGVTWQRSAGFGAAGGFSHASAVWAIPGGWEALVDSGLDGPRSIWRSANGLAWQQVAIAVPANSGGVSVTIGAGSDGTRLLSQFNDQPGSVEVIAGLRSGESRIQASSDGGGWVPVDPGLPLGRGVAAGGIIGPWPGGPAGWLLVTVADEQSPATYVSTDLREWQHAPFPRNRIRQLAFTRYGWIAAADTHCPPGSGSTCTPAPAQYVSADGLTWTAFETSVGNVVIVDGPAGVLGLSERGSGAWVLPQ